MNTFIDNQRLYFCATEPAHRLPLPLTFAQSCKDLKSHLLCNLQLTITWRKETWQVLFSWSFQNSQSAQWFAFLRSLLLCLSELENVKSFTRTNINKPDFTPRKARKSRHFWHFKPTKQNLWGFLWWINVDKLSIYGSLSIDLKFLHISSPKMACFC